MATSWLNALFSASNSRRLIQSLNWKPMVPEIIFGNGSSKVGSSNNSCHLRIPRFYRIISCVHFKMDYLRSSGSLKRLLDSTGFGCEWLLLFVVVGGWDCGWEDGLVFFMAFFISPGLKTILFDLNFPAFISPKVKKSKSKQRVSERTKEKLRKTKSLAILMMAMMARMCLRKVWRT